MRACLLLLLTLGLACRPGSPSFREVSALEGRELVSRQDVRVIQVGTSRRSLPVEGAQQVPPGWEWPPELADAGTLLIVGGRPEEGLRLAARLARAGIQGVVVVTGGVEAWNEARTLAAAGAETETMRE